MLQISGVYYVIDFVIYFVSSHPYIAFGMLLGVIACSVAFIIFMILSILAIATAIVTFTGFVFFVGQFYNTLCHFHYSYFYIVFESFLSFYHSIGTLAFYRYGNYIGISSTCWVFGSAYFIVISLLLIILV